MKKINNIRGVANHIVKWLKSYVEQSGAKGFTIGVSGGIDSAVTSTLCAMTGYPVIVVEMPIHQSKDQVNRAQEHITWLRKKYDNVSEISLNLTETYDTFIRTLEQNVDINSDVEQKMLTLSNTRSRLRMVSLYAISGVNRMLVCGTGNKVEDFGVGFYTKYGDGGVDISPIADLMKSEVYELGAHIGVNENILTARPTDGLWDDGRTDEDQIGATYDELEWAMDFAEKVDLNQHDLNNLHSLDVDLFGGCTARHITVLNIYKQRHNQNLHKINPIPVCEIPKEFYD